MSSKSTSSKKKTTKKSTKKKTSKKKTTTKKTTKKKTTSKKTTKKKTSTKKTKKSTKKKAGYIGQKVKKGDLIKLDLLGKTVPTPTDRNSVTFQVSNMDDAKKLPNFDPEKSHLYTPELVLVGEKSGSIFEKIGELLASGKMKYGDEETIILDPQDAFGVRDPKNIEKMSYKKFMAMAKEKPRLGMEFQNPKTNKSGTVIFVDQGRIRVDYNHPLAGRKVEYRVKPLERIDKFDDKVFAYISRRIPGLEQDRFNLDYDKTKNVLNIGTPDFFGLQQGVGMQEFYISYDLQNNLEIETVNFIHSYKKPPAPAPHDHDHDHDHNHDHDNGVDLGKDDSIAKEIAKPKKTTKKKKTTNKKSTAKKSSSIKKNTKKSTSKK